MRPAVQKIHPDTDLKFACLDLLPTLSRNYAISASGTRRNLGGATGGRDEALGSPLDRDDEPGSAISVKDTLGVGLGFEEIEGISDLLLGGGKEGRGEAELGCEERRWGSSTYNPTQPLEELVRKVGVKRKNVSFALNATEFVHVGMI
ncbi:unnamed protein product [Sphenostylis stenocarpa]|uniref:Uncharacterized protein n=1 Tax=Sphenostylis stenocarpa TaxID=92480 RepID=A0AA86SU80_9FABA|nr:unnamed protein product [Sphenostylis stenocarpa]